MGRNQMNKVCRKVAHAQLSDSSARKRYEELCKSISEHGKQCLQHANSLMAEMWAMAEDVYELKAVCKALGKPYESEAIRLCAGETAFHYLRDLHTAFAGNRLKALECAKAPYTLLREFRAERAAKNREKKCPAAEQYRGKYYGTADGNAIYVQKTSATNGSVKGDMAGGGHTTVLIADLRDELTAEQYHTRKKEIERTRLNGAVYVQKSTGKRLTATGGFNGVWTDLIPENRDNQGVECPRELVHYADLVLDEEGLKDLDPIPADPRQEISETGARPALPIGSSLARNIEMQPHVIDVVAELPVSVSAIGQPLAADDDAHPDVCPSKNVNELAQYEDAKERAEAFIKCPLFDGDVHKALDFLKAHFLEKPTDEHSVALPDGSNCADHTTAEKAAVCGAKCAMKRATAKKKTVAAKKQANPADTSWPPPIVCGEVSTWEEAKKGQYVMWGGLGRVMVIDDIQDSEIILEDPFYPKGTYPHEVARNMWSHVTGTTEDYVTSEFVRLCGKVPEHDSAERATDAAGS